MNRSAHQGIALALYGLVLPLVASWEWFNASSSSYPQVVRIIVGLLVIMWLVFLWQLRGALQALREGLVVPGSGWQWLATGLVAVLSFFSAQHNRSSPATNTAISVDFQKVQGSDLAAGHWLLGAPLALAAKRVSDQLRDQSSLDPDLTISQLQQRDPILEAHLITQIGKRRSGHVDITSSPPANVTVARNVAPVAGYISSLTPQALTFSFVRNGGELDIPSTWSLTDLQRSVLALHDGRLIITSSEQELLRALALRSGAKTLILHASTRSQLDPEFAQLCATLSNPLVSSEQRPRHSPRVLMLQASPVLEHLAYPLDQSLRRRIIEMACYLALHSKEPITGDRLRTRVLSHAGVDASARVLANVASALRRSLGSDESGNYLHGVTSSGLYMTHGLYSDIEEFHHLITQARSTQGNRQVEYLRKALELVHGEPLASSLRGFEWFIAEGHQAQLSRDGEWAALALCGLASRSGDVELAFWAIRQGLLLDPYSDDLAEALTMIPRLREFGSNRTSTAQNQPVGASGAIEVRWALTSLSQQIGQ